MGQVLHGSATTTEAIGRTIQHSQASLRGLARRYGITTILKGLTPYEHIYQASTKQPDRLILDPIHQMPGLNT